MQASQTHRKIQSEDYSYSEQEKHLRELLSLNDERYLRRAEQIGGCLAMADAAQNSYGVPRDRFLRILRFLGGDLSRGFVNELTEIARARKGLEGLACHAAQSLSSIESEMQLSVAFPGYHVLSQQLKDADKWIEAVQEAMGREMNANERDDAERIGFAFGTWLPGLLSQCPDGRRSEISWYLSAVCRASATGGDELAHMFSKSIQRRLCENPEDMRIEGIIADPEKETAVIMCWPTPAELKRLRELAEVYEPVLEDLQQIYFHGAGKLLSLLPEVSLDNPDSVKNLTRRTWRLAELEHPMPLIIPLIASLESHERMEFLDLCEAYPLLSSVYRNLRRQGLPADNFASFMLETGQMTSPGRELPLFDEVRLLAEHPGTAQNAAFLVKHSERLLHSADASRLLDLSCKYPETYIVLGDYIAAIDGGRTVRAELLLQIAAAAPPGDQLKVIRQTLNGQADEALEPFLGLEPELLLERLTYSARKQAKLPEAVSRKLRFDHDDAFREELSRGGQRFLQAYTQVTAECAPQLQALCSYVWRFSPESFLRFTHDAGRVSDSRFPLLLSDRVLLRMYLERLIEPEFDVLQVLQEAGDSLSGNKAAIRKLLSRPDSAPSFFRQDQAAEAPRDFSLVPPAGTFNRVVVFGGYYRGPKTPKILAAAEGLNLVLEDSVNWDVLPTYIGSDDLLILCTRGISHSDGDKLKHVCTARGTCLHPFPYRSYRLLISLLEKIERK